MTLNEEIFYRIGCGASWGLLLGVLIYTAKLINIIGEYIIHRKEFKEYLITLKEKQRLAQEVYHEKHNL